MKRLMFILSLGLMIGMVHVNRTEAQVHVSVNIDVQPAWGPSGYYYAEFYYIPALNIYYDVASRLFCYYNRGRWISVRHLPAMYSHYDFYSLYKVVLNQERYPWKYNNRHRRMYAKYRHNYVQVPIFYMDDTRYHRARNNYYVWVEPRHMPTDNGRPHGRDFSKNTRNGRIDSNSHSRSATTTRSSSNDTRSSNAATARSSSNDTRSSNGDKRSSSAVDRKSPAGARSGNTQDSKRTVSARSSDRTVSRSESSGTESSGRTTRREKERSNRE